MLLYDEIFMPALFMLLCMHVVKKHALGFVTAISGCYPEAGPNVNPIALGSRWLAYTDKRVNIFWTPN